MGNRTVEDPVFGTLMYDRGSWVTGVAEPGFATWGESLDEIFKDEGSVKDDPVARLEAIKGQMGGEFAQSALLQRMLEIAREQQSLGVLFEPEVLRRAGCVKLVVNGAGPLDGQRRAWAAFRDKGEALAEEVAARLLQVYQEQRPERLRWWKAVYSEPPDTVLPEIASTADMRRIMRPREIRLVGDHEGTEATVAIPFSTLWSNEDLEVLVRDGIIESVQPAGFLGRKPRKSIDAQPFGTLYRGRPETWNGSFHTDHLRGHASAWHERYRFNNSAEARAGWYRPVPPWSVITGNVSLEIIDPSGQGPSPAQAEAFIRFNADPEQTAWMILAGILVMYRSNRHLWIDGLDEEEIAQDWPDLEAPQELLEIITLQNVCVGPAEDDDSASVKVCLTFGWEDEHGIGVRWRNGQVEEVGDGDTADYWR